MRTQLRFLFARGACALLASVAMVGMAFAQPDITVLEFEVNEMLANNPWGGTNSAAGLGGGYGVTQGNQALVIDNKTSGCCDLFVIDVNGSESGEELNNWIASAAAATAIAASPPGHLSFDFGYDVTGVFADAFFQVGATLNSEAGFYGVGFGQLLGGNIGPTGNFPVLGGAGAQGATMTVLDPSNFAAGDKRGLVRVTIPVGPGQLMQFGDGGDPGFDYAQIGFTFNGGWPGFLDMSFDNVGFIVNDVVPEPTSIALLGMCGLLGLIRRTR